MRKAKKKDAIAQALGRRGGLARAKALTPKQRSDSARRAGLISKGVLPKPTTEWLVLDPTSDMPIVEYRDFSRNKAEAWKRRNLPEGVITRMDVDAMTPKAVAGGFQRQFGQDLDRQVQGLRIAMEALAGTMEEDA